MSKTIYKHVKGSVPSELLKKLEENPKEEFRITLLPEYEVDEDEDMPPEEAISDELVESVNQSEAAFKAGDCTKPETPEELQAGLKKIWDE